MNVRTTSRNGLLLWMNQGPTLQGDFLALAVVDGRVELSFNLGKKTKAIRITSDVRPFILSKNRAVFFTVSFQMRIDDGRWHRVKVLRKRRIGVLQVDKMRPSRGKSEPGASILNTDGKIWIGNF